MISKQLLLPDSDLTNHHPDSDVNSHQQPIPCASVAGTTATTTVTAMEAHDATHEDLTSLKQPLDRR